MSEHEATAGQGPERAALPEGAQSTSRSGADRHPLLLAVERVGGEVAALGQALATQPEQVAARLDIDALAASFDLRMGALGSALDRSRLMLLAALDRTADRMDAPVWLPALQTALTDRGPAAGDDELRAATAHLADNQRWSAEPHGGQAVLEAIAALADDRRLDEVKAAVAGISAVLERAEQRERSLAARLDRIDGDLRRLTAEPTSLAGPAAAVGSDRESARLLTAVLERVERLEMNLGQHLSWVGARLSEVAAHLVPDDAAPSEPEPDSEDRLAAVLDLLAGIARRQGELSDGVRAGAAAVDALELGDRLASINHATGRAAEDTRIVIEHVTPMSDRLTAIATQVDRITPLARAGDRAGSLFDHLDRVGSGLDEVISLLRSPRAGAGGDEEGKGDDERFDVIVDMLDAVARRQAELAAGVSALQEQGQHPDGILNPLADLARRQDELAASLSGLFDQVRVPVAVDAMNDRMEQRERSLAARLDHIDEGLRRLAGGDMGGTDTDVERLLGENERTASSLKVLAETTATAAESLAALVASTGERLESRLSEVEAIREAAARPAGPPEPSAAIQQAAVQLAAHRLAELRAERAGVEALLQEERRLAAGGWHNRPGP